MKTFLALVLAALISLTGTAFAQDTSNAFTSNVNATSNQQASSSNQGVTAQVNSYGADHQHVEYRGQVPLSQSGYGSFSQDNCMNAVSSGITTLLVSGQHSMPVPDINCQKIVRSKNQGQQSLQAWNEGKRFQAEDLRAMSVWEACQVDEQELRMCIRMGKIRYVDPSKPDIHDTVPVMYYTDARITGDNATYQPSDPTAIQSHPAGWTNEAFLKEKAAKKPDDTTTAVSPPQPEWRVAQASGTAGR